MSVGTSDTFKLWKTAFSAKVCLVHEYGHMHDNNQRIFCLTTLKIAYFFEGVSGTKVEKEMKTRLLSYQKVKRGSTGSATSGKPFLMQE